MGRCRLPASARACTGSSLVSHRCRSHADEPGRRSNAAERASHRAFAQTLGKQVFSNLAKICSVFSSTMRKNIGAQPTRLSRVPARVVASAAKTAVGDAGHMFFLLRMTFWLGLVLVLLP